MASKIISIEREIIKILDSELNSRAKITAEPAVDLAHTLKQPILINIQYIEEELLTPANSKANQSSISNFDGKSKLATKSKLKYRLRLYYKDSRLNYDQIYETIDQIKGILNGYRPSEFGQDDLTISPISITSVRFVERNDNSIIQYNLEAELCCVN